MPGDEQPSTSLHACQSRVVLCKEHNGVGAQLWSPSPAAHIYRAESLGCINAGWRPAAEGPQPGLSAADLRLCSHIPALTGEECSTERRALGFPSLLMLKKKQKGMPESHNHELCREWKLEKANMRGKTCTSVHAVPSAIIHFVFFGSHLL